ncbi:MAG: hypothetical protein JXA36_05975 [Coriobacteriia bacterium]|nr:hypothetical protein [Coriobacteriia bacterium]
MNRHLPLLIACLIAACLPVWAVARTTPVEVLNTPMVGIDPNNSTVKAVQADPWYMNILGTPNFNVANSPTVKIDATTNTVKAAQSGTWSVGVSSMPTVSVNTHAVTQSGAWNVGITGTPSVSIANAPSVSISNTPSVSVSNSPTVKIDATTNAVDTPTKHNTVQLWATNQTIPNSSNTVSPSFSCAGYDELRFMLWSTSSAVNLMVYIRFRTPLGSFLCAKQLDWGQTGAGPTLPITCPVYGDTCQVEIYNGTGSTVVIYNASYVYLVN